VREHPGRLVLRDPRLLGDLLHGVVPHDALHLVGADLLVLARADPRVGLRGEPVRLRVLHQLLKASALQELQHERGQRGRERAHVHAACLRSDASAGRAAAEQSAEDVLEAAGAAAAGPAEQPAEQVVQPAARRAAALRQVAQDVIEPAHRRLLVVDAWIVPHGPRSRNRPR
jgi:hypothetical protein